MCQAVTLDNKEGVEPRKAQKVNMKCYMCTFPNRKGPRYL